MKKLYFSTLLAGLENPIGAMLHKEGGVAVERMLPGAALYRSVREPALPYVHQTFEVLFQMKPMKTPDEAIRRLMATGGWLDRFPYGLTSGHRFRIVTAVDDKLVSANMRLVSQLEDTISEMTGMRTQREKPDVELWVLCRPEAAYFLWRLGKRNTDRREGQLRGDVCAVLAFLSGASAGSAALLGGSDASLPMALKGAGVRMLTCICADEGSAKAIGAKVRGVRAVAGSAAYTDLAEQSQDAVLVYVPAKSPKTPDTENVLRSTLYEARRIVCTDGRILVMAPIDHAQSALRRTQGVRMEARYDLLLSGVKCGIWMMTPKHR